MSLYRQATGASVRLVALAAALALLVGAIAGFAIGRSTADEPALTELIAEARAEVRPALNALELVTIEYPESIEGGRVVAETEYDAALAAAQTAIDTLRASSDLEALTPSDYQDAQSATDRVASLIEDRAAPATVEKAARRASAAVESLAPTSDIPPA
jgi:hypothetical protein